MLFNRRVKPNFIRRIRDFLWPRAGLRRSGRYIAHRVRRMPGTPYAIAAGFACGAAVSMTPFPGFHFLLAGLFAWGLRASIIASAIGTVVGNPWTFPLIWLWIFKLGTWILGADGNLTPGEISMGYLWQHPRQALLPMVVGAVPTAIVTWFLFFWVIRRMVARYQVMRQQRLSRAAAVRRTRRVVEQGNAP